MGCDVREPPSWKQLSLAVEPQDTILSCCIPFAHWFPPYNHCCYNLAFLVCVKSGVEMSVTTQWCVMCIVVKYGTSLWLSMGEVFLLLLMNYQKCLRAVVIWSSNVTPLSSVPLFPLYFLGLVPEFDNWVSLQEQFWEVKPSCSWCRAWRRMNWGVIVSNFFNFTSHIFLVNFTKLQCLLCCPYVVSYIHCSRMKCMIVVSNGFQVLWELFRLHRNVCVVLLPLCLLFH